MTWIRQPRTLSMAAGLVALGVLVNSASASHSWGGYHWARTTPQFNLKLGDNLTTTDWKLRLSQAASDWNNPLAFQPQWTGALPLLNSVVPGQSNKRCAAVAGTTQVCNSTYGKNGWLGLASIHITGGVHITDGTAKMNDSYFSTIT